MSKIDLYQLNNYLKLCQNEITNENQAKKFGSWFAEKLYILIQKKFDSNLSINYEQIKSFSNLSIFQNINIQLNQINSEFSPSNYYILLPNDFNLIYLQYLLKCLYQNLDMKKNFNKIFLFSKSVKLKAEEINCNLYNFELSQELLFTNNLIESIKEFSINIVNLNSNQEIVNSIPFLSPIMDFILPNIIQKVPIVDICLNQFISEEIILKLTSIYSKGKI